MTRHSMGDEVLWSHNRIVESQKSEQDLSSKATSGTDWMSEIRYLGGSKVAETTIIREFIDGINEVQASTKRREGSSVFQRGFHAKMHAGIANALFEVQSEVPEDLRFGIFQPGERHEGVEVRFSNASGMIRPDPKGDLRGVAIRVKRENGKIQDFLLTNAPASHAKDAREFMISARARASSKTIIGAFVKLLVRLGPLKTFRMLSMLLWDMYRPVESLASERYFSRAPYAFCSVALKFRLEPTIPVLDSAGVVGFLPRLLYLIKASIKGRRPGISTPNYLREELVEHLREKEITFEFQAQRHQDARSTPIEDGTAEWRTPFTTIATLKIPRQDLNAAEQRDAEARVEQIEFNPWNTADDIQPVGSLNRARKVVYDASVDLRKGRRSYQLQRLPEKTVFRVAEVGFGWVNKVLPWHKLWRCLGLVNLAVIRHRIRRKNLYDDPVSSNEPSNRETVRAIPSAVRHARNADGGFNDLLEPTMGKSCTRFGRNVPLSNAHPDPKLQEPDPHLISEMLLKRQAFIPVRHLNLLTAAWIQFQVHGWLGHERVGQREKEWLDEVDPSGRHILWDDPQGPTRLARTPQHDAQSANPDAPPAYINTETHWWDGSQLYGSCLTRQRRLRCGRHGKLKLDGLLLPKEEISQRKGEDPKIIELTGFNDNWWLGLSLMHTLFAREHNEICNALTKEYPTWDDQQLFDKARLINAALMAKIHTLEWSPALFAHPTVRLGFDTYWWGLASQKVCELFTRFSSKEVQDGILCSATNHHRVPYAMTEEFVSVYRLHSMLPDDVCFFSLEDRPIKKATLTDVSGEHTRCLIDKVGHTDTLYSFGVAHPAAMTLHNFPNTLRKLKRMDGEELDLAAVDILRDRERGVPRYNEFRQLFGLRRFKSFKQLAANEKWAQELEGVYGKNNVDDVDLQVGMLAETPLKGFGVSETAFFVFVAMASRRLQSDRFFTTDYRPEVYTSLGMEWINRTEMKDVLLRHHPQLTPALEGVDNPFFPWNRLHI